MTPWEVLVLHPYLCECVHFFSVQLVLMWSDTRLAVVEYEDKKYDKLHEPVTSGSHNLKRAEKQ